ncbi:hypothetical protein SAY87_005775 [Trapa incisa]|uniref:Fungal lipase-type domain-containing protein n=1 Tax=Trapa incisa TaxID=236973 RepID=A0AAN7KBJ3_9MYRT|nr:hypothetical protein SAY87_005775 [Trapa incisa]
MASTSTTGECDKSFSSSYLQLRPEKLGLFDLLALLLSSNLNRRKFVESSEETEERFERRWIIFISIVAQKLLLAVARPLSWFGSLIELWLNLVRINGGGLSALLFNLVRGKVVVPETTSADFVSMIGNVDLRLDLDETIPPEDQGYYYTQLSMMSAKAAYENEAYLKSAVTDHWKMEFLGFFNFWNEYQEKANTQAFMLRDGDKIVLAFRGTEPFNSDDWCSDFDISWYEIPGMGTVHGGFMKALGLQKSLGWPKELPKADHDGDGSPRPPTAYYFLRKRLKDLLLQGGDGRAKKFIVTGHSLGGALAVLFPAVLGLHGEKELLERLEGVYTYGQPRVGDPEFREFMQKIMRERKIGYYRFVYCNDMVSRLPFDNSTFHFEHFGRCHYYDSLYDEQIVDEVPNKNYFTLKGVVPMMVNAMYELWRSFTIVACKGPEYRESLAMTMLRVVGLAMPGLPAHCPMDYNNSIRLGRAAYRASKEIDKDL